VGDSSTPWALRLYGAVPLSPALTGLALALILIVLFLGSEIVLGRLRASPGDLRVAIVHILICSYFPTAYVYVILWSRRTVSSLRPALACSEAELVDLVDEIGRYSWRSLAVVGILSVLAVVRLTIDTTPAGVDPWDWSQMFPEVRWHRVLGVIGGWCAGCFLYAVSVESHRLFVLARRLRQLDLFDLRPLMPFTRQALGYALLILGSVSVYSLFLVEARFLTMVISMWIGAVILATVVFLLPVLGVHRMIRSAKLVELDWCRDALRRARSALESGTREPQRVPMDEVVAYKQVVDGVREWPFDSSTLLRFALYLLIPLASWSGGALAERVIDSLLE
jgi:hypothetical protein